MNTAILHLTEDQLDDLLIGEKLSPDAQAHLDACDSCRARLAAFQSTLASFNQATEAWSEAKSNTLNRDLTGLEPTPGHTGWILAGGSVAAAVVVGVALAHSGSFQPQPSNTLATGAGGGTMSNVAINDSKAQPSTAAADRAREIAEDNAMLGAIDSAIRPTTPPTSLYEDTNLRPQRGRRHREDMD